MGIPCRVAEVLGVRHEVHRVQPLVFHMVHVLLVHDGIVILAARFPVTFGGGKAAALIGEAFAAFVDAEQIGRVDYGGENLIMGGGYTLQMQSGGSSPGMGHTGAVHAVSAGTQIVDGIDKQYAIILIHTVEPKRIAEHFLTQFGVAAEAAGAEDDGWGVDLIGGAVVANRSDTGDPAGGIGKDLRALELQHILVFLVIFIGTLQCFLIHLPWRLLSGQIEGHDGQVRVGKGRGSGKSKTVIFHQPVYRITLTDDQLHTGSLGSISGILHPAVDKGVLIHWGNRFTHGNREGGIDIHRTAGDYGGTAYIGCGI